MNVFGATGFVGKRYCELFAASPVARGALDGDPTLDTLYLISTTDNYNVFDKPTLDIETNLLHLVRVLERHSKESHARVFNFISSWFVYGDCQKASEDAVCNPKGFYSITKRCAEQLVQSYCATFGINYRIIRLCNVFGPGDKKVSRKKNALQALINDMKQDIPVRLYHGGRFYRHYMFVDDVVRAIDLVCREGAVNEIYNVAHPEPDLFIDVIELARKTLCSKSVFVDIEPPEFHRQVQVKDVLMTSEKLHSLGFQRQFSLADGIRLACEV